ncbi:MAG TPA: metallophosphoesterase family protein [Thermoleophilaceae bacterium]|nr:metallophosphoesterase family protein [Thermoleophilaceae bacterium]
MTEHPTETLGTGPARVAVLSDVHGNLPAFEAVIEDIRKLGVDAIWNLGDLVGYGAQPDECVELARQTCDLCLIGNHDLVVIGKLNVDDFSANAATAALWTRDHIKAETRDFLKELSPKDESREMKLYHASPRDPIWEYVLSVGLADACLDVMPGRLAAVGHSHVALWFWRSEGGRTVGEQAGGGMEIDLSKGEWLLNPGGVGQPRDGDPRASWVLLDFEHSSAKWHRVEYPIDQAAKAIEDAGLPRSLADRLYFGQ